MTEEALSHGYRHSRRVTSHDSSRMSTRCECGVDIVSVSPDEDDVRIAVASHNETPRHTEWRAVEAMKQTTRRGPCICKGGDAALVALDDGERRLLRDRGRGMTRVYQPRFNLDPSPPAYAILGPCRCQGCGAQVWWARGYTRVGWNGPQVKGTAWWRNPSGGVHRCAKTVAA